MKKSNQGFYWNNRGPRQGGHQRDKPIMTNDPRNSNDSDANAENIRIVNRAGDKSFSTELEPGAFIGWKLYFPEKTFADCPDLARHVRAMEKHFKTYIHWYDTEEIRQKSCVYLKLQNLEEDLILGNEWKSFFEELKLKPSQTLGLIGLAMHNAIVNEMPDEKKIQCRKIYVRPVGFGPRTTINNVFNTSGELISVSGTVIRMEPARVAPKTIGYQCRSCSSELVVKQNSTLVQSVHPSSCRRGCTARGRFVEMLSSPFTMFQPKQMIRLQESFYVEKQAYQMLDVELTQNLVDSLVPGNVAVVTGVLKHSTERKRKIQSNSGGKSFKAYVKAFNVETITKYGQSSNEQLCEKEMEFITTIQSEPSPFRLLVHSLCPTIFGREEVKAGLCLALMSGHDLLKKRRSECHVMMVGNPGTGKSKLLQACAEVAPKGIFVCGPTSTAAGLTASVGPNGTIDAGALVFSDCGVCCLDELDKMSSNTHILLEAMEQQVISILKCGVRANLPSRTTILAAANPIGSFYDKNKTLNENIRIATPLLSRFDLIFPMLDQPGTSNGQFVTYMDSLKNAGSFYRNTAGSSGFFNQSGGESSSSQSSSYNQERNGLDWLKLKTGENIERIPKMLLQKYIAFARENIHPVLSDDATAELKKFYIDIRQLKANSEIMPATTRLMEALLRLTLARARADMAQKATREHVLDVIALVKFSMIDVFVQADAAVSDVGMAFGAKKSQNVVTSSMSKPKQIKAYLEHIQEEAERLDRKAFTVPEMKEMAKEIGIKDYDEIIWKLNDQGFVLKTPSGYRLV